MPYVPGCSADVFVSYAHEDNDDGWVTRLRDKLTQKLSPFFAGRAEVWFDDRIGPGVYFKEEIQQQLKNTPILVAVVTPSYLGSSFCMVDELEWFQNQGGKHLIQLLKVPLEEGYEVPVPDAHYENLFDEAGQSLTGRRLGKVFDRIVASIVLQLRGSWEARPKVYLAQLRDPEFKPRWDRLKEKLHAEGYAVLPKGILPVRVPDATIRTALESVRLSIHLDNAGNDPLALRQLELARQIDSPLLVLPEIPGSGGLQSVLAEVQRMLEEVRKPAVYCIYDHYADGPQFAGLFDPIADLTGCQVMLPESGEKYHKFRLRVSDGILLFRGEAPEEWFESQQQVLLQASALRGDRVATEAHYFVHRANGNPPGVDTTVGERDEWIIDRTGDPTIDDLKPFVEALRARVEARGGPPA